MHCHFMKISVFVSLCLFYSAIVRAGNVQIQDGTIIRGPVDQKRLALVFTAHTFGEEGDQILAELSRHHAQASFFLTGGFLANPAFAPLVSRIMRDGHYLGPHSDKHLLYADWNDHHLLVTQQQFRDDLEENLKKIEKLGIARAAIRYFLPAYEQSNSTIAKWSSQMGLTLVNYTPGTRSNADYTGESDKNFVSSQTIFNSIVAREQSDPHGLNGFILLLHLGAGPSRKDKFAHDFGLLLDYLAARGYRFVRIDELISSSARP